MHTKLSIDDFGFYNYLPNTFTSLSRNSHGLIAASRSDGSIEVYDETDNFYMLYRFPSSALTSICAVCWIKKRLFACGGEGRVFELNFISLQPRTNILLPGGLPSRCLIANDEQLIAGNDGGYISVISSIGGFLEFKNCLTKLEGKVMCLAVDSIKHGIVAAGDSIGKVHLIDFKTGNTIFLYVLDSNILTGSVIAWSLLFIDGILFSGDSRGTVSLWNVEVGGLVTTFTSHRADVLALTASSDNRSVFASGVDPTIRRFEYFQSGGTYMWQYSGLLTGCRRDVRSLVFIPRDEASSILSSSSANDRILAVGDGARLELLTCPSSDIGGLATNLKIPIKPTEANIVSLPLWPNSLAPTAPVAMQFAQDSFRPSTDGQIPGRLCLVQYTDRIELFHMPSKKHKKTARVVLKLAHIKPKRREQILACCISSCGKLIAYSDSIRSRILKISHPESWKFDPTSPSQLVSLSRLGWVSDSIHIRKRGRKSSEERSSASEIDTDSEDQVGHLFLDQSSGDLFSTTQRVSLFDDQLLDLRDSTGGENSGKKRSNETAISADQRDESSALPSARLLAFTPNQEREDERGLVALDATTQQIVYRDVVSGVEMWRFTPGMAETGVSVPVHLMKMRKVSFKLPKSGQPSSLTFLVLGCLDGRVLLHCLEQNGKHLFTCPKVSGHNVVSTSPRPVAIAFHPDCHPVASGSVSLRISILYTSGQLTEWMIPVVVEEEETINYQVEGPTRDPWLQQFWTKISHEWRRRMPCFHSMDYVGSDKWVLSSRTFVVYIDRGKECHESDVKTAFAERVKKSADICLRISSHSKTIIETTVLPDRIVVMKINTPDVILQLPAPLHKKRFGT